MARNVLGFLIFFMGCLSVLAEPAVIFKGEPVVSAEPYRLHQKPVEKTTGKPLEMIRQEIESTRTEALKTIQAQPPSFHFPYKMEGLSLGKVSPTRINKPELPRPFFLLGGDERSRAWLKKNLKKFKAAGAIGFLVEAKSMDELNKMRELAGEVQIWRFDWSGLAQEFGVNHYPVYITATSIEQ